MQFHDNRSKSYAPFYPFYPLDAQDAINPSPNPSHCIIINTNALNSMKSNAIPRLSPQITCTVFVECSRYITLHQNYTNAFKCINITENPCSPMIIIPHSMLFFEIKSNSWIHLLDLLVSIISSRTLLSCLRIRIHTYTPDAWVISSRPGS